MELLQYEFVRNALLAGIIISVLFGFLSFFVVVKRLSFLSVGISHAAFGGIAIGIFTGLNPYFTAIAFCLITGFLIAKYSEKTEADSVIGIFFAFTMALGVIFLTLTKDYTFDVMSYLFGSILGITQSDLKALLFVCVFVFLFFFLFFKEIVFVSFDKTVAKASGLPVDFLEKSFVVILTAVIVFSIKLIGIILVSAFLILPATVTLFSGKNYKTVILLSVIFALINFLAGFYLSFRFDLPTGATIVSLGALIFFLLSAVNKS